MVIDSSLPPARDDGGPVEATTKDVCAAKVLAEKEQGLPSPNRQRLHDDGPVPLRDDVSHEDGVPGVVTTNDITMQNGVSAFIGTLPSEDKEAYVAATLQDAELVKRESDPALFTRLHSGSLPDAARAMALYWKERRAAFSSERFALRMDLSGVGAMSVQDAKAVESGGAVSRLPNDREGRAALWFDLFKLQSVSRESRLRAYFFLLHCALSDASVDTAKGYAIVCCMDASHGELLTELPVKTLEKILATPPSAIHIVLRLDGSGPSTDEVLEALEPSLAQVADGDLEDRLFFHVCRDAKKKGPPKSLLAAGFQAKDLPACVGGAHWSSSLEVDLSRAEHLSDEDPDSPSAKRRKLTGAAKEPTSKAPFASLSRSSKKNARKGVGPNRDAEIDGAAMAVAEDERRAYLEAKKTVPHLIKKETPPMDFLVATQNDVNQAAARLVENWRKRKDLFGSRAFHPLTQTGEGALNRPDLTALSTGVFLVLPVDSQGRAVLYFDCAKIGDSTRDSLRRLAFYMLSVACEVSASPDWGIVVLISLQASQDSSSHFKVCFRDILEAMPGQVVACHVVCFQALQQNPNIPQDQLRAVAEAYFGSLTGSKLFVHMDRTRSQALEMLRMHGLSRHSLPKSIGGSWGVERFVEWCELRTRFEWGLPPAASHKGVEKVFDFSHIKPPSLLNEEDRIERARRMNVLHSRRKRERERIEIEVLHEQCDEMRTFKSELIHERSRLEALLTTARSIVANPSPDGGDGVPVESNSSASQGGDPTAARQFVSMPSPVFVSADSNGNFRQSQQQQSQQLQNQQQQSQQLQNQHQQNQQQHQQNQPENAGYYTQGHYFTNASGQMIVPQGQAFVHQGQTFVQQNQANSSQGTFVMAPSASTQPYCLVPSSASGMQAAPTGYTMQQVPAQGMPHQHMHGGVPQQQFVPVVEVQYQQGSTPYFMQVNGGPAPAGFVQSPGPVSLGYVQAPGPAPGGFVQTPGMSYSVPVPVMTTSAPDFGQYFTTTTTGESTAAGAAPTILSDESSRGNAAPSDLLTHPFP